MTEQRTARILNALEAVPTEPDAAFASELRRQMHHEFTAATSVDRTTDLGEIMIDVLPSRTSTGSDEVGRRRISRPLVGFVAAAVLLLAGIAAGLVIVLDDDDAVVVRSSSQPTTVEPAGPVEVVEAAILASNAGDLDGFYHFFADGGPDLVVEIFTRANRQIDIVESCAAVPLESGDTLVECVLWTSDDFYGPAGLVDTAEVVVRVNSDNEIVTWTDEWFESENGTCCPPLNAFNIEFLEWLEIEHPDVFDEIGPAQGDFAFATPGYLTENPEHMVIALDYVDEFIAQSDNYPIESAGN